MNKKFSIALVISVFFFIFTAGCSSTPKKEASLHQLIQEGRIDEAKDRFVTKYDINEIDSDGNTALHLAAAINDSDLVTFLIIKKADIDLKNYQSQTPLHVAIEHNSIESAQVLVSFGANIFARNSEGITAMDMAFERDSAYYDIFITTKTSELRDIDDGRNIV
ncbi:ankyrin repeat domain-containing protein, partial [Treponema porcinum]|uniref:ankyrin repeat domain-containing protein n=1 Tax=Treponema porcinum TaxID=261392 RepID=UPI002A80F5FC